MTPNEPFTEQQQNYLQGFVAGCDALRGAQGLPTFAATLGQAIGMAAPTPTVAPAKPAGPADDRLIHIEAQQRFLDGGQKLCVEEQAKRSKDPFQMWDQMQAAADEGRFPKGTDVFLYKYHGLFYVAPAQNAFMCRLRFAGGMTNSHQLRGVADIAERFGGGYADATTRANLQIRQIAAENATAVVSGLMDLGIICRGSGADNIRNVTATATAGIDPQELIDTRPLARQMHNYILQHPEMYGLPRKFNIAFDGAGVTSALADTNDIGFFAVRIGEGHDVPAGVYFRMELGGITGHGDFARDCGILLKERECVPVAAAIVKAFLIHGDRTDRKKARLKYVLERFGLEGFLCEAEEYLPAKLRRFPLAQCEPRPVADTRAHLGFHPQKQDGLFYAGIVLPVGRMSCEQMRGLAAIAERYGSGTIRLTVWQNLLISDIREADLSAVQKAVEDLGLSTSASSARGGLVACTGNAGCKYAAANTKAHAIEIADYLDERLTLQQPVNIHLTGCHHSCAQHYIGDIGLLATKVSTGDAMVEGYHVFVGGGYGENREIGRKLAESVRFEDVPPLVEQLIVAWQSQTAVESFREWSKRQPIEALQAYLHPQASLAG